MSMFDSVKLVFNSEDHYQEWISAIRNIGDSINGVRYDARGYHCVYLNKGDDYSIEAIAEAKSLGAEIED